MVDYLRAHWRGELSLGVSYWINGSLITLLYLGAVTLFEPMFEQWSIVTVIWVVVPLTIGEITLVVWQLVGIWRSATNSATKTGRSFWPAVAKFMVVLGVIRAVVEYSTLAQDFSSLMDVAHDPTFIEYEVEQRGETDVFFTGAITNESVDDVLLALTKPNTEVLQVNSRGGLLIPAIRLGRHIRQFNVQVIVNGQCLSACVLLLAASQDASIVLGSTVAFHRPQAVADFTNSTVQQAVSDSVWESNLFLQEMGVPRWAMEEANRHEFWYPTLGQLVEMELIKFVYDPSISRYVPGERFCRLRNDQCE